MTASDAADIITLGLPVLVARLNTIPGLEQQVTELEQANSELDQLAKGIAAEKAVVTQRLETLIASVKDVHNQTEDEVNAAAAASQQGGGGSVVTSALTLSEVGAADLSLRQDPGAWQDSLPADGPNGGIIVSATLRDSGRLDGASESLMYNFDIPGIPAVADSGIYVITNRLTALDSAQVPNDKAIIWTGVPGIFGYAGMRHFQNGGHIVGHDRNRMTFTVPTRTDAIRAASVSVVAGTQVAAGAGNWAGQQAFTEGDGGSSIIVSSTEGRDVVPSAKTELRGSMSVSWDSTTPTTDYAVDWGEYKLESSAQKIDLTQAIPLNLSHLSGSGAPDSDPESIGSTLTFDEDTGRFTLNVGSLGTGLFNVPSGLVRWLLNLPAPRRDDATQGVYILLEQHSKTDPATRSNGNLGLGVAGNSGLGNGLEDHVVSWVCYSMFTDSFSKFFAYNQGTTSGEDRDNGNFIAKRALVRLGTTGKLETVSAVGEGGLTGCLSMGLDASNELTQTTSGAGGSARGIDLEGPGKAFFCCPSNLPAGVEYEFSMSVIYVDELPADMAI